MRNGSNRRRWTIFSFAWELWLITTQSTLILLDLEYNLYNDYYSVHHHPRCFQFGRGTDFPLQVSAKRGNWKRQGYPRPYPLICGSARDEKRVNKIINIEENKLLILLTFTMTDASLEAQWLVERPESAGYVVFIVFDSFYGREYPQ